MRFEPQGYTKNPDIRIAKSLIDYIFRWLGITFLPGYKEASMGVIAADESRDDTTDDPSVPGTGGSADAGGQKSEVRGQAQSKPRPPVAEKVGPKPSSRKAQGCRPHRHPSPQPQTPSPYSNGHANGHSNGNGNGHANGNGHGTDISAALLARAGIMPKDAGPNTARSEQFADFQSDAPPATTAAPSPSATATATSATTAAAAWAAPRSFNRDAQRSASVHQLARPLDAGSGTPDAGKA